MNKKQRDILTNYKFFYDHVVVDGCDDPDCVHDADVAKKEFFDLCDKMGKINSSDKKNKRGKKK